MKQHLANTGLIVMLLLLGLLPNTALSVGLNQKAPDFSVQNILSGKQLSLNHFQGQVVYLDFWASWCKPCQKSFPFMEQLTRKYGEQGLVVIAVNLDENPNDMMDFLVQIEPTSFYVAANVKGDIATRYNVQAMPSTYLIGRDGKIKMRHLGFNTRDMDKLQKIIERSL